MCRLKNFQSKNLSRYSEEYQVVQGLWWQKGKRLHIIHENTERSRFSQRPHFVHVGMPPSFTGISWHASEVGGSVVPQHLIRIDEVEGLIEFAFWHPFQRPKGCHHPKMNVQKKKLRQLCSKPFVIGVPAPSENDQRDLDHPQE